MAGSININQNNNQVILLDQNRQLVITNNNTNTSTNVTQPITDIVEVKLGPKGPKGDIGPQGPVGPSGSVDISSLVTTSSFNSYTGSSDSQFSGTASFSSTSSAAIINTGVSNDNQYILTVQDASDTTQQIQLPSTPFIIRPSIQNNISGESDKAAELQVGLNNQAGAISLISNLISGNPNYIKTFNQDLYLKVKNAGTGKLYISASAGVETTGHITGSIDSASLADEASNNFDTISYNNTTFNITAIRTNGGQQSAAITTVPQSNRLYIDYGDTSTTPQFIPTYTADGGTDGYKNLHVSLNPISYYYRTTNRQSGVSQQADELRIGGGSNTAGGIFLNSTSGIPSYVSTDGPLHLFSQGYKVEISSSANNVEIIGHITASSNISSSGTVESNGLILTSPNGTRYQISVANDGTLSTTAL